MQETKLHFQRFEFKYLLSFQEFHEIRKRLSRYVALDGFAKQSKSGFYEVLSLYYDSPKFYYYNEKIDGARNRKKIRLRTYQVDGAPAGSLFLEIKRKFDAVILKDRLVLDRQSYERLMQNEVMVFPEDSHTEHEKKVAHEFYAEHFRRSLEPKVFVRYRREPYLGRYNKNFRVTFDYDIGACESRDMFAGNDCREVLPSGVVMEIKFNGRLPHYITEIIGAYNLQRAAYSKYCHAAEACYALRDMAASRNFFFTIDQPLAMQSYE